MQPANVLGVCGGVESILTKLAVRRVGPRVAPRSRVRVREFSRKTPEWPATLVVTTSPNICPASTPSTASIWTSTAAFASSPDPNGWKSGARPESVTPVGQASQLGPVCWPIDTPRRE